MTEKEIEALVKQLPYLNKGETYIIHREEGRYRFEYLLPNGELIITSNNVPIDYPYGNAQKRISKNVLKDVLRYHKYIGIGTYHRHVRSR